jgi:hypothetical protein
MKKIVLLAFAFVLSWYGVSIGRQWIDPYGPKDLTQIHDQDRSHSDGNPYNTWSYPGNINPTRTKKKRQATQIVIYGSIKTELRNRADIIRIEALISTIHKR